MIDKEMEISRLDRVRSFLARVSSDEARRSRLVADPRKFLEEEGVSVPSNVDIEIHENTQGIFHLVFPPDPNAILDDEALTAAAGGKSAGSHQTSTACLGAACSGGCGQIP